MSTDCRINHAGYGDLMAFFIDTECSIMQFKLLCFMARHPQTRLNIDSIAQILGISKSCLKQEMAPLIEKGVLTEQSDGRSITYSLSCEPGIRQLASTLLELDWSAKANLTARLKDYSCS